MRGRRYQPLRAPGTPIRRASHVQLREVQARGPDPVNQWRIVGNQQHQAAGARNGLKNAGKLGTVGGLPRPHHDHAAARECMRGCQGVRQPFVVGEKYEGRQLVPPIERLGRSC